MPFKRGCGKIQACLRYPMHYKVNLMNSVLDLHEVRLATPI